jgi:rhomboid protease GluP
MNNREGYVFWSLAHTFIADHDYRIIQFFESQKELWLEKVENKKAPIIRILLHDLNWGNALQRDIEFTAANGERVRKQIRRRELHMVNIYVSQFPPVDDYDTQLTTPFVHPEGNKTKVSSILFAEGEFATGFQRISEKLGQEIHIPINEDYSEQEVESVKKAALEHAKKRVEKEKALLLNGKPFFTYVFMIIQIVVFFWLQMNGGSTNTTTLIKYGAKVNQLIYEGEWWRFITPVFLHIGFLHLVMNTLALYFLGTAVERIYGNVRFSLIYLFAGVTGFIASFIFSVNLSAGASGAIFGCFGAMLYFGVIHPKLFFRTMGINLLVILGINLVFGFSASGIDNAGHLGGLAGGFLAAGVVHFPKSKKLWLQMLFLIGSVAIVWGSLSYGFGASGKVLGENSVVLQATEYVNQGDYDQAYNLLIKFEEKEPNPTEKTYLILAFVELKLEMFEEAKTHLHEAISMDPRMSEAYYYLALINLDENDLTQAKDNADKAAKLKPDDKDYANLVREINQRLQSSGGGE